MNTSTDNFTHPPFFISRVVFRWSWPFVYRHRTMLGRVYLIAGSCLSLLGIVVGSLGGFWWGTPWLGAGAVELWLAYYFLSSSWAHRVGELEQSRNRVVEDSATRLRRIERDLHDGAQAQLVALAMKLGLAREKLADAIDGSSPADLRRVLELVDAAHHDAKQSIVELRDLARGIHPPVLDQGLEAALASLAARSELPVDLVVDLPERPPAASEAIAYFCAAELLTNVAKHSGARHATVEATQQGGMLRVLVRDDGNGGAHLRARGGLAGIDERVRTVDGRLLLDSASGGPTVITIELPIHV